MLASLIAALYGSSDMALGNVIGSNISNIGLVLGLAAVILPVAVHRQAVRLDAPLALGGTVLVILLLLHNDSLVRWEGLLFLAGIVGYTLLRIHNARSIDKAVSKEVTEHMLKVSNPVLAAILVGSLGGLAAGSFLFVHGARNLAEDLGVSEAVIGLTIMAVGTSLPEMATVIAAARKGMSDLVVGNVVGSNIFNILSVLGVTASIVPLNRQNVDDIDLLVFGGSALVLLLMMMRSSRIGRIGGAALLTGYAAYVAYLYLTG
jgi:cation:H+ antiporter